MFVVHFLSSYSGTFKNAFIFFYIAYNAIWDPEERSVTRFLQCKSCSSQSPRISVPFIAAEVLYPGNDAEDQVPNVRMWDIFFA